MKFRVWVWGLGFGVWGLGFGVWGLGFGVWGLEVGGWGSGFQVSDFGSRVHFFSSLFFQVWGLGLEVLGLEYWVSGLGLAFSVSRMRFWSTRPVLESGTLEKLEHSLLHNPGTKQFYRLLFKTCVYNLLLNLYWE